MIDISDVANLRRRGGGRVLQAIKGVEMIAYETETGGWWVVHFDGRLARTYDSPGDLIHCLPDPWAGLVLPECIELRLYENGTVLTGGVVVGRPYTIGTLVSARRFRIVPMEGEE